jgi:hypothetical protein
MKNQIAIRCADGKTVYMKCEKSPAMISCKNVIAGIMLGVSAMASAMIAFTYM